MSIRDLYTDYIANWISGGSLINRESLSSLGIKPLFDRILTKKYIKKVFCIERIPLEYEYCLANYILAVVNKISKSTRIIITTHSNPLRINTHDDKFRRQMTHASRQYSMFEEMFDSLDKADKVLGKKFRDPSTGRQIYFSEQDLENVKVQYNSYEYTYQYMKDGGQFSSTYLFIELLCRDDKELRKVRKEISSALEKTGVYARELSANSNNYMKNFSPTTYLQEGKTSFRENMFSDENIAHLIPYRTRGMCGSKHGVLLGVDQGSQLPFMVDFFNSGYAQIVMLTAISGHGKTYQANQIALSMLADGNHVSVVDIKGDEWNKLAPFTEYVEISMGSSTPRFVNTLRLDDIECTNEDCIDFFDMAVRGTKTLVSILVNLLPNEGNIIEMDSIVEEAIHKLYNKYDVRRNRAETFKFTRYINYGELLPIINDFAMSDAYPESKRRLCDLIRDRCMQWFNSDGSQAQRFSNEITLGEVLNSPLVIYSLNKNTNSEHTLEDSLSTFMVTFLDMKKQFVRKRNKEYTICFYEELQRKAEFKKLLEFITNRVTGSRSSNVIIFLLFNSLAIFKDGDTEQIRSNITSYVIGALNPSDIELAKTMLNCENIIDLIEVISDSKTKTKFVNCFATQIFTGSETHSCLNKVILPDDISRALHTKDLKSK